MSFYIDTKIYHFPISILIDGFSHLKTDAEFGLNCRKETNNGSVVTHHISSAFDDFGNGMKML